MKKRPRKPSYSDVASFLFNPKQAKIIASADLDKALKDVHKPSLDSYSKALKDSMKRTAFFIREEMRKA